MKRIMVLVGGQSNEREISLKTGRAVARALASLGEEVRLLDTGRPEQPALPLNDFEAQLLAVAGGAGRASQDAGKAGRPFRGAGKAVPPSSLVVDERRELARRLGESWQPDVVFIALHGGLGENGTVQALLDWLGLPYTGCGMEASALAMDKMTSKRLFRDAGLAVPEGFLWRVPQERRDDPLAAAELAKRIDAALGYPAVVKPNREGSSVGLAVLRSRQEAARRLPEVFRVSGELLAEEFIAGREITAAVLDGRCLPLVEILPESGLYDYEHKYSKGKTRYECPAKLHREIRERIEEEALLAWDILGCRHLARIDFRLAEDNTPYCLEVNSIPGMTETSLFPMAAAAAGLDFPALVAEIARLALEKSR